MAKTFQDILNEAIERNVQLEQAAVPIAVDKVSSVLSSVDLVREYLEGRPAVSPFSNCRSDLLFNR